jgi:hypothetical protein
MVIKSRSIRLAGHAACTKQMRNPYNILVSKPEWKTPVGRPRCRWEVNIVMDLRGGGRR